MSVVLTSSNHRVWSRFNFQLSFAHPPRFPYGGWLLYFAVSLAWRCSVTSSRSELARYPQHIEAVETARTIWAEFLLEKAERVNPYRFNIFFTPAGVTSDGILPEGLSWYLLRAPDATPVYSQARTAIYVKLPGMLFWTSVVPPDPGGWKGTKIAKHGTVRLKNQWIKEKAVGQFLVRRIETVFRRMSNISSRQRQRIADAIRDNPERVEASLTIQALLDDERIRGENLRKS